MRVILHTFGSNLWARQEDSHANSMECPRINIYWANSSVVIKADLIILEE